MKKFFLFIFEVVKVVIVSLAIIIPVRYFLIQPFFVRGASMEPNFNNGDYLIVDELSYRVREPERGEVIVFRANIIYLFCIFRRQTNATISMSIKMIFSLLRIEFNSRN